MSGSPGFFFFFLKNIFKYFSVLKTFRPSRYRRRLRETGERTDLDIIHVVASIVVVRDVEVVHVIVVVAETSLISFHLMLLNPLVVVVVIVVVVVMCEARGSLHNTTHHNKQVNTTTTLQ